MQTPGPQSAFEQNSSPECWHATAATMFEKHDFGPPGVSSRQLRPSPHEKLVHACTEYVELTVGSASWGTTAPSGCVTRPPSPLCPPVCRPPLPPPLPWRPPACEPPPPSPWRPPVCKPPLPPEPTGVAPPTPASTPASGEA